MALGASWWWLESGTVIPFSLGASTWSRVAVWTAVLAVVNFGLFRAGRRRGFARPVYQFFEEDVFPMVRDASLLDIAVVASVAGFAEELLFRGMLQPRMGIAASSVLFGVLHGPEAKLWPLALWATLMGALFGVMYRESENMAVPMLVHGLYDALALYAIRRSR